nr:hypothetical protein [Desmonostoc geniculatum HA4340-LM1]
LSIYFGQSAETTDFIVDCLTVWWRENQHNYLELDEWVIDLDGVCGSRNKLPVPLTESVADGKLISSAFKVRLLVPAEMVLLKAIAPVPALKSLLLLSFKVTGLLKVMSPVVVMLLATLVLAAVVVKPVKPATAPTKVIFPVPAVTVKSLAPATVLLKLMLPPPAPLVTVVGTALKMTGPVKLMSPPLTAPEEFMLPVVMVPPAVLKVIAPPLLPTPVAEEFKLPVVILPVPN